MHRLLQGRQTVSGGNFFQLDLDGNGEQDAGFVLLLPGFLPVLFVEMNQSFPLPLWGILCCVRDKGTTKRFNMNCWGLSWREFHSFSSQTSHFHVS